MKKIIISLLIFCHSLDALAFVEIERLLPNPVGDDTLGEYITIRNRGCESVDITGYILKDLSAKSYTIPSLSIASHESISFRYAETKITLNNSGLEEVYLIDPRGVIIDTAQYSGTQLEGRILEISGTDEECQSVTLPLPPTPSATGSVVDTGATAPPLSSGSSLSGTTVTESGIIDPSVPPSDPILPLSDTGVLIDDQTGGPSSPASQSGYMPPLSLTYSDEDQNGKIDTLEIEYGDTLTGEVFLEAISLFSATGGLSSGAIWDMTGAFLDGVLSGNLLILTLDEFDLENDTLMIDDTDLSDLRLSSRGDLGFTSLGGLLPEDFSLTGSFSAYRSIYHEVFTQSSDTGSGVTDDTGSTLAPLGVFPEIIPTLQSPSTVTLSGDTLICTQADCRVNVTFLPIFSSGFLLKDYLCHIGSGEILDIDDDCNPTTYTYTSTGKLIIELVEKDTTEVLRKEFGVVPYIPKPSISQPSQEYVMYDRGSPYISLEFDTKIDESIELSGETHIICHTGTCSLNWTAEKSYDPEGSSLEYFWDFGNGETSRSRDPGTRKYPPGEYHMVLRVTDRSGNMSERIRYISVHRPDPREPTPVSQSKSSVNTLSSSPKASNQKPKKTKPLKMRFFDPPQIVLEGKNATKDANGEIICRYLSNPYCNFNLNLTGSSSRDTYIWSLDGEEVYTGKNPKSWQLDPGVHSLTLMSYIEGALVPSAVEEYIVRVIPTPKVSKSTKKPAKSTSKSLAKNPTKTVKKPVTKSSSKKGSGTIVPVSNHPPMSGPITSESKDIPLTLPLVFFSGALLSFFVRKKPYIKIRDTSPPVETMV